MAAIGDLDLCEKNKILAWKTVVEPSIEIASIVTRINCFLIYLSTDYVFEGEKGNYKEYDVPSPINYYGFTKLLGEQHSDLHKHKLCNRQGKLNLRLWPWKNEFCKISPREA